MEYAIGAGLEFINAEETGESERIQRESSEGTPMNHRITHLVVRSQAKSRARVQKLLQAENLAHCIAERCGSDRDPHTEPTIRLRV